MKNFSKMRQGLSYMVMAFLLMLIPADMSLHFQKKWSGMEKLSEF